MSKVLSLVGFFKADTNIDTAELLISSLIIKLIFIGAEAPHTIDSPDWVIRFNFSNGTNSLLILNG